MSYVAGHREQQRLADKVHELKRGLAGKKSWRRVVRDSPLSDRTWQKLTSPVVSAEGFNSYNRTTLLQAAVELKAPSNTALIELCRYVGP